MRLARPRIRRRSISLTPLIDIVFILVVFLMLASTYERQTGLPLAAPATGPAGARDGGTVLLRLHADGRAELGGTRRSVDAIVQETVGIIGRRPGLAVLVHPMPGTTLGQTIGLLDRLHQAGLTAVRLDGRSTAVAPP